MEYGIWNMMIPYLGLVYMGTQSVVLHHWLVVHALSCRRDFTGRVKGQFVKYVSDVLGLSPLVLQAFNRMPLGGLLQVVALPHV